MRSQTVYIVKAYLTPNVSVHTCARGHIIGISFTSLTLEVLILARNPLVNAHSSMYFTASSLDRKPSSTSHGAKDWSEAGGEGLEGKSPVEADGPPAPSKPSSSSWMEEPSSDEASQSLGASRDECKLAPPAPGGGPDVRLSSARAATSSVGGDCMLARCGDELGTELGSSTGC